MQRIDNELYTQTVRQGVFVPSFGEGRPALRVRIPLPAPCRSRQPQKRRDPSRTPADMRKSSALDSKTLTVSCKHLEGRVLTSLQFLQMTIRFGHSSPRKICYIIGNDIPDYPALR